MLPIIWIHQPLSSRQKLDRRALIDRHAAELANLSEDDDQGRADLLNRQQQVWEHNNEPGKGNVIMNLRQWLDLLYHF